MGAALLLLGWVAAAEPPPEASAPAEPRPQLIVLELKAIDVEPEKAELLTGRIADVLGRERAFETLTATDLRQMMDVAAERQALGCDAEDCIAEIAAAYGARYVVYGRVAKVGDLVLMQLSLFDSEAAKPINRREIEGATVRDVLDATAGGASDLVAPLTGDAPAAPPPAWSPGALFWVGGSLGVTGLAAGVGLGAWAGVMLVQLNTTGGSVPRSTKDFARGAFPFAATGAGVGGAVALLGAGLLVTDFFLE